MHPSLFTSLVLLDPVLEENEKYPPAAPGRHPAQATAKRRDIWPSVEEAENFLRSRPFYKTWDPRVLDLHIVNHIPLYPSIYPPLTIAGAEVWHSVTSHSHIPRQNWCDLNNIETPRSIYISQAWTRVQKCSSTRAS